MTTQLQLRRDTAANVAVFTGAQGEVVVDTTNNRLVVQDGVTAGGVPAAKLSEVNAAAALTGTTLAANVTASSLTSVGTLTGLAVAGPATQQSAVASGDLRNTIYNTASGTGVSASFSWATGTANAYAIAQLIDNNGAPAWVQSAGPATLSFSWKAPVHQWQSTAGVTYATLNATKLAIAQTTASTTTTTGALTVAGGVGIAGALNVGGAISGPSFTGDTGSGGTAGLVPAPPAGSAASNEVLGAGGAWVGQTVGFRNRLRNASFAINQHAVSGTVTLTAGVYGHDGAKAGASGCTYTFAASGLDTTLTITAGSLILPIETSLIEGGVYVVSQAGTAQARVWQGTGATGSGSYATAPFATASLTAATQTNVEFSTGTVLRPQFEPGAFATLFERRPPGVELALCQRYFWTNLEAISLQVYSTGSALTLYAPQVRYPVPMRATPTLNVTYSSLSGVTSGSSASPGPGGFTPTLLTNAVGYSFGAIAIGAAIASAEI